VATAIAEGRRPEKMREDEKVVYDFCNELLQTTQVTDATYAATAKLFGEQGVIDLIGAMGYYSMVSMILNTDRYPLPEGVDAPLKAL
jgi:4-carboxymuconolactone decarboxylase